MPHNQGLIRVKHSRDQIKCEDHDYIASAELNEEISVLMKW